MSKLFTFVNPILLMLVLWCCIITAESIHLGSNKRHFHLRASNIPVRKWRRVWGQVFRESSRWLYLQYSFHFQSDVFRSLFLSLTTMLFSFVLSLVGITFSVFESYLLCRMGSERSRRIKLTIFWKLLLIFLHFPCNIVVSYCNIVRLKGKEPVVLVLEKERLGSSFEL